MSLNYRLVEQEDLPALQRLWKEEAGWGTLAEEMWQKFVVEAPLGGVAGVVACESGTGQIVGQFAFVPSLVSVDGREVRAFRPAAPVLAKSVRFRSPNPLSHPVVAMYNFAVKALRARGDGLIYMVPDARWVRFFKMFPFLRSGTFPLWKLPLPLAAPLDLGEGFSAEPLHDFDERVDNLWEAFSRLHPCAVVRDSRTLKWKIGDSPYEVLSIERDGAMVGLVASRRKGQQWLICDVVAADAADSLRATLVAACNLAHERSLEAEAERPIPKVTVLTTPIMEPAARELGFTRDAYDFPLVVHLLDPSLKKDAVAPARWYVSAND